MIDEKKLIKDFDENNMFLPEAVERLINNQPKVDEWITDRNPTKEECGEFGYTNFQVTVNTNKLTTLVMNFEYTTIRGKDVARWKWNDRISPWEVIAWKPLSKPYIPTED